MHLSIVHINGDVPAAPALPEAEIGSNAVRLSFTTGC
jgi:hypothetical protein